MGAMLTVLSYVLYYTPAPLSVTVLGTVLLSLAMLLQSHLHPRPALQPGVHYKDSALAKYLLRRVKRLDVPYSCPWPLRSPHVQTLVAKLMSHVPSPDVVFHRQYLQMKDKGVVSVDWAELTEPTPSPTRGGSLPRSRAGTGARGSTGSRASFGTRASSGSRSSLGARNSTGSRSSLQRPAPILLIIPSLYLGGGRGGVASLCRRALRRGFQPVVFNKRGQGGSYLTTPRLQSFGDVSDLRQTVRYLRAARPATPIAAAAFSFDGSGLLFSYLGEYGSSAHIAGSVCLSPGYDMEPLLLRPDGVPQPYHFLLLLQHKRHLATLGKPLEGAVDVEHCLQAPTLGELEQRLYGRLHGHQTPASYWERNNPMRDADDISTPVLCINSLDDPVCAESNIPLELFKLYPNFLLVTSQHGGHCGFLEGSLNHLESWGCKATVDYLSAVMDFMEKYESNNHKR